MAGCTWHEPLVEAIRGLLQADDGVSGLVVVGSLAGDPALVDEWSDLDLLLVVADSRWPYPPAHEWLGQIAPLYGWDTQAPPHAGSSVTRAYLADGHRVDVVEARGDQHTLHDPVIQRMLRSGARVLFSRSTILDSIVAGLPGAFCAGEAPPDDLHGLAGSFRFKAMWAVGKIVRNDLLVAQDLLHRMAMDCCRCACALRDRQTGTDHHRWGRPDEPYNAALPGVPGAPTPAALLDAVEAISQAFHRLWTELSGEHPGDDSPLADAIRRAREALGLCGSGV